ncbi:MAG: phosphatase PAP2 family protein [Flavobacteriales bacterium]
MKALRSPFLLGYLLVLSACLLTLLLNEKIPLQLATNQLHQPVLDAIMPYLTMLGDGIFVLLLGVVYVLFIHRSTGWLILISYLFSSLIVQFSKHVLFPDAMRPFFYLKSIPSFHAIPDFLYYEYHSFPSGHTASAFALATILSFSAKDKPIASLSLLCVACLVGFSRTYLSQHFLVDVMVGSLIGVTSVYLLRAAIPSTWFTIQTPYLKR